MISLDPVQLVREAEVMRRIRKAYEASPENSLPKLSELSEQEELEQTSPVLETYVANLEQARKIFLKRRKAKAIRKRTAKYGPVAVEQTCYGLLAECDEEVFFTELEFPVHYEFVTYPSCMVLIDKGIDARAVLHWEFMDCSQPDGCTRTTDKGLAAELLHNSNYLLPHQTYSRMKKPVKNDPQAMYEMALCSLQSYLSARLASSTPGNDLLITSGYLPLRSLLREFRELVPGIRGMLENMDYIVESTIVEINTALLGMPLDILCVVIANMPFDDIAVNLPEIRGVFAEMQASTFKKNLESTKKHVSEVDSFFDDDDRFDSFIRDALQ